MSFGFLTPFEIALIKLDFKRVINGPEGTTVTINHYLPSSALVDEAFGVSDIGTAQLASAATGRCLQEILFDSLRHGKQKDVLEFGMVEVGDCVFYFDIDIDLDLERLESVEIVAPGGILWEPIPRRFGKFYQYLRLRLGNAQVAQVVACRYKGNASGYGDG